MSRNGSGVYSLPTGYLAETGETVEASQHNLPLEDLETDMNTARPVVAGGTGSTTAAGARANLGVASEVSNKSGNYTVVAADRGKVIRCTADLTLSLTAAATLGSDFPFSVKADGGDVTIDPDSSETIDGETAIVVPDGYTVNVWCNGSAFFSSLRRGGAEFIATADLSNDATAEFTGFDASKYDAYEFVLQNVIPSNDDVRFYIRTSTDNGSSYDAGASDYSFAISQIGGANTNASTAVSIMDLTNIGNGVEVGSAAGEDGVSMTLRVIGPHLSKSTFITWHGMYVNSAGNETGIIGAGSRKSSADVDAVQFTFQSGNLESGTITMYGLRNA